MTTAPETAFIYSERYQQFDYGPDHPLRNTRLALTHELCQAYDLLRLPSTRLVEARDAAEEEIIAFHRPDYVEVFRAADRGQAPPTLWDYGLGTSDNPIFPGVYAWSLLSTGASLRAMELVDSGQVACAFNIAGGLHHAAAARAAGFCYFNDAAVIIKHLVRRGRRVAYVDIDAHHGDGVQFGFYDTDQVLTLSIHESGESLFPGTGFVEEIGRGRGIGYAVNVPLLAGSDDEIFLWALDQVVPPLLTAFNPDVVVTQLGADTHRTDPLTNLALTTNGFAEAVRRLRSLCRRWIALGGGGYNLENVPRSWTLAWAIMNQREVPDELPESFRATFERLGFRPSRIRDDPYLAEASTREQAWRFVREQVHRLQKLVFPLHGI
ncbi:MAG: acetoin utilization protein AcuC [candidate division NC10 bacterium]|nr:acetoin utilization protein AcuC [candidate division NC10 bacterium]